MSTARLPRRILAIQHKRIGDLLLTTPALAALRAAFPEAEISLCGSSVAAALAPALPMVDRVLPWKNDLQGTQLAAGLFLRGADLAVDFTGTDRSALLSLLSRAGERRAFRWVERKGWRARAHTRLVESSVRERHTVDHYLDLVEAAPPNPPHAILALPPSAEAAAAKLLGGGACGYAVVHPGSARAEKHWAPENWASLLAEIADFLPAQIIITGSADATEQEHITALLSACQARGVLTGRLLNLAGHTPLLTLAALIKNADFLLGVDSAAVHFAGAFRTPSLALYGPTNPYHWRVRSPEALVLQAGNPTPTLEPDFAPRCKLRPMQDLSVKTVAAATTTYLKIS